MCLLGAAAVFLKDLKQIPQNCFVRLIFQPAEEAPGGAEVMIKDGVLKNVHEIYGFHNFTDRMPLGTLVCPSGPFYASRTDVDITVIA